MSTVTLLYFFIVYIVTSIDIDYVGVEKLNDVVRRIHLQKSNKWDAAKDVLLAEETQTSQSTRKDTKTIQQKGE